MKHSLMLIESPNKINTITKYLKNTNIEVFATIGHIRELNEKKYKGLGFDEKTYQMEWRNDSLRSFKGRSFDVIKEINNKADKSDEIFLSTDPDREGEAIAWHIYSILDDKNRKKCKRVVFNEITKDAIDKAFKNPRDLDQNQINSYLARKILDRGLGFKLSGFSREFIGGASAGRVQSIALKFLKDKYDEIQAFVPEHWFNIYILLENGLELTLKSLEDPKKFQLRDSKQGSIDFVDENEAKVFLDSLDEHFTLVRISDPKSERRSPPKPFKTSTMQSTAINRLGMSVASVDRIAQKLYEGVEVDGEFISLITYPRTDREDLSDTFTADAKKWLTEEFGDKYVQQRGKKRVAKSDKKNLVQGAHEAIRPTYIDISPDSLEGKIDDHELNLYRLIWLYSVSSLMSEAMYNNVLHTFDNSGNTFTVNHRIETFDGFQILFRKFRGHIDNEDSEKKEFPDLTLEGNYRSEKKEVCRVDKKPPSPYTESTLIKSLEEKGIGRPSTYAHIVGIILKREYANKDAGKLIITDLGINMSSELSKFFPNIMQYDYTRNMEQFLDDISDNKFDWKKFLDKVFNSFNGELDNALEQVKNLVVGVCPECTGFLKKKHVWSKTKGHFSFIGCDNYPKCTYVQQENKGDSQQSPEKTGEICPECGGDLVKRISKKFNKPFVGCGNFPSCSYIQKTTKFAEEIGRSCPKCKDKLLKKFNKWNRPFISCSSYPKCKYIEDIEEKEETGELCPECSSILWKFIGRYNNQYLKCSSEKCKFYKSLKKEKHEESHQQ